MNEILVFCSHCVLHLACAQLELKLCVCGYQEREASLCKNLMDFVENEDGNMRGFRSTLELPMDGVMDDVRLTEFTTQMSSLHMQVARLYSASIT